MVRAQDVEGEVEAEGEVSAFEGPANGPASIFTMQSLFLTFEEEFRTHAGRKCPSPRGLVLPKIVDWDEDASRFTYDEGYARKRPDWTYA